MFCGDSGLLKPLSLPPATLPSSSHYLNNPSHPHSIFNLASPPPPPPHCHLALEKTSSLIETDSAPSQLAAQTPTSTEAATLFRALIHHPLSSSTPAHSSWLGPQSRGWLFSSRRRSLPAGSPRPERPQLQASRVLLRLLPTGPSLVSPMTAPTMALATLRPVLAPAPALRQPLPGFNLRPRLHLVSSQHLRVPHLRHAQPPAVLYLPARALAVFPLSTRTLT